MKNKIKIIIWKMADHHQALLHLQQSSSNKIIAIKFLIKEERMIKELKELIAITDKTRALLLAKENSDYLYYIYNLKMQLFF